MTFSSLGSTSNVNSVSPSSSTFLEHSVHMLPVPDKRVHCPQDESNPKEDGKAGLQVALRASLLPGWRLVSQATPAESSRTPVEKTQPGEHPWGTWGGSGESTQGGRGTWEDLEQDPGGYLGSTWGDLEREHSLGAPGGSVEGSGERTAWGAPEKNSDLLLQRQRTRTEKDLLQFVMEVSSS